MFLALGVKPEEVLKCIGTEVHIYIYIYQVRTTDENIYGFVFDGINTQPTLFSLPQLVCLYSCEDMIAKTIAHISAFDREVENIQILLYPTPIRTRRQRIIFGT
jgi:hypothetical protein